MQTWLAYSVFQSPPQERPPAGVPVSQLDVATTENGQPGSLLIFYATDGTKVWVGAPSRAPPPNDERWIRAPQPEQTTAAFAGNKAPICTDPPTSASTAPSTTDATTATTIGQAVDPPDTSSGNDAPWVLIALGLVVIGAAAVVSTRARRRRAA